MTGFLVIFSSFNFASTAPAGIYLLKSAMETPEQYVKSVQR